MNNSHAEALQALREKGLLVDAIQWDAADIVRCPVTDKPHGKDGAYLAFSDTPATIWWQNWRTGATGTWCEKGSTTMSESERQALKTRMEASKAQREAEQQQRNTEATARAKELWQHAQPASEQHPYLAKKGIAPHALRQQGETLLVPLTDEAGQLVNLQRIFTDGTKRFLSGGRIKGCFSALKGGEPLIIAEGYATAASLYAATGGTVLAAMSAGNLLPVARAARNRYPDRQIVIAGDNDCQTEGNPGKTAAEAAAKAIGALLATPPNHGGKKADFNDIHAWRGLDAVRVSIEQAAAPEAEALPAPILFDEYDVPAVDLTGMPDTLKSFVQSVSECVQVPEELVLMNALASMAVAAQGRFHVKIHDGYQEPLNIYAIAALPPGERKSSVVEICSAPIRDHERDSRIAAEGPYREALSKRRTLEKVIESKRSKAANLKPDQMHEAFEEIAALEKALPEVPAMPRLLVDDATPESLAALLAEQDPQRLGMMVAEGGFFDILAGRYSSGAPNLDLVLKSWSGESVTVDRRSAPPILLSKPLLTICLSPQPELVRGLADKPGFRGRGLLGRFLYVLPQSRVGYRNTATKPLPEASLHRYRDLILRILSMGLGESTPLTLAPDAVKAWHSFFDLVEVEMRSGGTFETCRDWAGKLPGQTLRLAGLLHLYTGSTVSVIQPATMDAALSLASCLAVHAQAVFMLMNTDPVTDCARRILAWIQRQGAGSFSARDCHQALKGSYPKADDIAKGLSVLEERFCIKETPRAQNTGRGRPSKLYDVHPEIIGGGK